MARTETTLKGSFTINYPSPCLEITWPRERDVQGYSCDA